MRGATLAGSVLLLLLGVSPVEVRGGSSGETRDKIAAFREAMKADSDSARIAAVAELATLPDPTVEAELRKVVSSDRSDLVRAEAARCLGRRGGAKNLRFLVSALRSLKKRPVALAGAVDGIGGFREPKTVKDLYDIGRAWLNKNKYPAFAAIRALAKIPSREAVDDLIKLFDLTYPRHGYGERGAGIDGGDPAGGYGYASDESRAALSEFRPWIVTGLQRLTGEGLHEVEDWKEWWKEFEGEFDPAAVTENPNMGRQLLDLDFGYEITRPGSEWQWVEAAEEGFSRTAHYTEGGKVTARLSVLAYAGWSRKPSTASDLAAAQKDALRKAFSNVETEKWAESVKVGEEDGVRQTIAGVRNGLQEMTVQTIVGRRGYLYVVRYTLTAAAGRGTVDQARTFAESFAFID